MLDNHAKIALRFSGGKDSLACLELLRPIKDRVTVIWVNTGATYEGFPEYVRECVKDWNFVEVQSDQPSFIKDYIPSDLCPTKDLPMGRDALPAEGPMIIPWFGCCNHNLWQPLHKATLETGATCIVTGQKACDIRKDRVKNGEVVNGIEYQMPLHDMTDEDVYGYLREKNVAIPSFYERMETSPDCWDCTAFLDERKQELATMRDNDPDKWAVVSGRIQTILTACDKPLRDMRELM